jgi:ankyrin repeat protein
LEEVAHLNKTIEAYLSNPTRDKGYDKLIQLKIAVATKRACYESKIDDIEKSLNMDVQEVARYLPVELGDVLQKLSSLELPKLTANVENLEKEENEWNDVFEEIGNKLRLDSKNIDTIINRIYTRDSDNDLLIHKVSKHSAVSKEAYQFIAGKTLDLNSINGNHLTALQVLFTQPEIQDVEAKVRSLLNLGANPNNFKQGLSPLELGIERGSEDIVKLLLAYEANPNNYQGELSPLETIVSKANVSLTKLLLEKGADPNMFKGAKSLLEVAIERGKDDIVKLLLAYEVNPNNYQGELSPLETVVSKDNFELTKLLLEKGADPNVFKGDKSPLELAIGVDPKRDPIDFSPLKRDLSEGNLTFTFELAEREESAIERGKDDIVKLLLAYEVNPNNYQGELSPLEKVVNEDNFELTKLLLEKGADPNAFKGAVSPLEIAINSDMANRKHRFDNARIERGVSYVNEYLTKLLLDYKANPNTCNARGFSPLQTAIREATSSLRKLRVYKNFDLVELLLEKGACPNSFKSGSSPLYMAIGAELVSSRIPLVTLLLKYKANPNQAIGSTVPILIAMEKDSREIFNILLEHGAQVDIFLDSFYRTSMPLLFHAIAIAGKQDEDGNWCIDGNFYIKELLRHGACKHINFNGPGFHNKLWNENSDWTALHIAAAVGNENIVEALLEFGAEATSRKIINREGVGAYYTPSFLDYVSHDYHKIHIW